MLTETTAPSAFLSGIFGDLDRGYVVLWRGDTKQSIWLDPGDFAQADKVCENTIGKQGANLYYGVGVQGAKGKANERGDKAGVIAIPGCWADIDFAEAASRKKSKKKYPPREIAEQALITMPIPPSAVVATGGGLHAYWLFHELMFLDDPSARGRAEGLVKGWQSLVAEKLRRLGSYEIDHIHDLSRVLRVVGSWNYTHGCRVELVKFGLHCDPADLEEFVPASPADGERPASPGEAYDPGTLVLSPDANPPVENLELLIENSVEFKQVWRHKREFPSNSEREASIARYAAEALWPDQEIANLIIAHRRKWEPEKIDKTLRQDYIKGIISLVRGDRMHAEAVHALCAESETPAPQPPAEPAASPAEIVRQEKSDLDHLSAIFGVQVARWIQFGREDPIYSLVLDGGRDIRIGSAEAVLKDYRAFQRAIYQHVGIVMKPVGKKIWPKVCERLAKICEVDDALDATDAEQARAAVQQYLRNQIDSYDESKKDIACMNSAPFYEDGHVYLCAEPFTKYANTHTSRRWDKGKLLAALKRLGFQWRVIGYNIDERRTTRGYWHAPHASVRP